MESKELRALRAAIEKGSFAPAYYLYGDDEYRKDVLVRDLVSAAVDATMRDFNLDTMRGGEVEVERLESMLHTPPMMATRRAVVVRDTDGLKKDARASLEKYLKRPSPDTVLVLVALAGTKEEKGFATSATAVQVAPLGDDELAAWLVEQARALHQVVLAPEAAALLVERVGNHSVQLTQELDKLASHAGGAPVDVAAIRELVGERQGESLGDLLDRVAARDLPGALALVEPILAQPRNNAVSVIMALTVQALAMSWGQQARARGLPAHQLEREYFGLLKETGAFPMSPWGEAAKRWAKHLGRWDASALGAALRALQQADQSSKDTRLSSDAQLLSTLLCAMCAPASRAA
jgi:DNA polymerase-3 subunit delta